MNIQKTCQAEGCLTGARSGRFCAMHYKRLRVYGSLDLPPRSFQKDKTCCVDGCLNGAVAKGLCSTHRLREKKYGDVNVTKLPSRGLARRMILDLINMENGEECIFWPFSRDDKGYAQAHWHGIPRKVGGIVCEEVNGRRPDGNPREWKSVYSCGKGAEGCVNPRHIYWGRQNSVEAEKEERGAGNQGEGNGQHKFLETDIPDIRWATLSMSDSEIAEYYGVTRKTIARIRHGTGWKHVT